MVRVHCFVSFHEQKSSTLRKLQPWSSCGRLNPSSITLFILSGRLAGLFPNNSVGSRRPEILFSAPKIPEFLRGDVLEI